MQLALASDLRSGLRPRGSRSLTRPLLDARSPDHQIFSSLQPARASGSRAPSGPLTAAPSSAWLEGRDTCGDRQRAPAVTAPMLLFSAV